MNRRQVARFLVCFIEGLFRLLLASPTCVRLGELQSSLSSLGLFTDSVLVLEASYILWLVLLFVAVMPCVFRRMQITQEEAHG